MWSLSRTGMRGADIIHGVVNAAGRRTGMIVWESKRTKAWSDGWIAKLKDDQRKVHAELAVLVSEVLPKEVRGIGQVAGVWVTGYSTAGSGTLLSGWPPRTRKQHTVCRNIHYVVRMGL